MNHLAILKQPWLNLILQGKKTIESRFMKVKQPPFGCVHTKDVFLRKENDIVYFRESSDFAVIARAEVRQTRYEANLKPEGVKWWMTKYQTELQVSDEYITSKLDCKYMSLIWLGLIQRIMPFPAVKHDQRAWIVDFKIPKEIVVL